MAIDIYARTVHVCIFTIKLCHDFTIKSSRKSREINGYYPVKLLAKI